MLNILAHLLYAIKIYDPDGHYDMRPSCSFYTVPQKVRHFYFHDNFGNSGPIFIFFHY